MQVKTKSGNHMGNNKQLLILEWFKKYVLMKDLKEKSPEVLRSCITLLIVPFLAFYLLMLFYNEITYAHDFTKLEVLDGVVKINHYTEKHKYVSKPVIDIHVSSESKDLIYYITGINIPNPLYMNINDAEGQRVRVWYLPGGNQFYLIKFLQTNKFDDLMMVRETHTKLINEGNYARFIFPVRLLLVLLIVTILQLLLIRFEIFRNYDLYFVEQRWDWQRPVKAVLNIRYFTVIGVFFIWPFIVIFVCI